MGCDGVFEVFSNQQLIDKIASSLKKYNNDLKPCLNDLLDEICAPDTSSNISNILFLIL